MARPMNSKANRNPYKKFLGNALARRLYIIIVGPVLVIPVLPVLALIGIRDGLKDILRDAIVAFKDSNSYK